MQRKVRFGWTSRRHSLLGLRMVSGKCGSMWRGLRKADRTKAECLYYCALEIMKGAVVSGVSSYQLARQLLPLPLYYFHTHFYERVSESTGWESVAQAVSLDSNPACRIERTKVDSLLLLIDRLRGTSKKSLYRLFIRDHR
jgi:hypothetical protein